MIHLLSLLTSALTPRRSLATRGERAAARHLKRKRCRILARNLHAPIGEIDLLVEDRTTNHIALVEVKTTSADAPAPELHINHAKQRKLSALATWVAKRYNLAHRTIRFDVVAVVWPPDSRRPTRITHHPNAFQSQR